MPHTLNAGWSAVASLAASSTSACATSAVNGNHAYCWREVFDDAAGSLVNRTQPASVESSFYWRSLSVGHYINSSTDVADSFACGIRSDGSVSCWGSDFSGLGLLGAGVAQSSSTPLALKEAGPWSSINAGHGFACGIKSLYGVPWCW